MQDEISYQQLQPECCARRPIACCWTNFAVTRPSTTCRTYSLRATREASRRCMRIRRRNRHVKALTEKLVVDARAAIDAATPVQDPQLSLIQEHPLIQ